jgi:D-aminopeptidase
MKFLILLLALAISMPVSAQRARELGVPMEGTTGPLNAITDVAGVEVGFTTLIEGEGLLNVGHGPIRTGVTALFPRGKENLDPVFGAWFTLNGNGEMTGTTWIEESGFVEGPVMITNTHSVGVVRDAVIKWVVEAGKLNYDFMMPVVAETYDGLNDINGQHVKTEHAMAAMDAAAAGPVKEGNVGGGTGMTCHGFKGGTGTSSQEVSLGDETYTVGVLVQCNYGARSALRIAGVPVGLEMEEPRRCFDHPTADVPPWNIPRCGQAETSSGSEGGAAGAAADDDRGSIIIIVATDAPVLPHQLKRIVKRASLGVGKMGGIGGNSSGDIFLAFSTANPGASEVEMQEVKMLPNEAMNRLFQGTVWAVEEAIVNALLAAETMTGVNYLRVPALPHDRLLELLKKYNRIEE